MDNIENRSLKTIFAWIGTAVILAAFGWWVVFLEERGFFMKYGALLIGFTIGNFIWQFFTAKDYGKAFDISFAQAMAIGLVMWWVPC